jgi:hypothetical protein
MKIVMATLTNNAKVIEPYVWQILMQLEDMVAAKGVIPLYELLRVCKDPNYQPLGTIGGVMHDFGLLIDWDSAAKRVVVHEYTRNVVLAAVQVEGPELSIRRDIIASTEVVDR